MDIYFGSESSDPQSRTTTGQEEPQVGYASQKSSRDAPSSDDLDESHEKQNSSRINNISSRAQELVEKINNRRTKDQREIESFQDELVDKVKAMCCQMKEHIYMVYEHNSDEMQVRLQELSEVLDSCTKLTGDLMEASQALACLNDDLVVDESPE